MIGARLRRKLTDGLHERRRRGAFCRPFSGDAPQRLLLLTVDHRIPQSQIFPFHFHADRLRQAWQTEIREADIDRYLASPAYGPDGATVVAFQSRFDLSKAQADAILTRIGERNPGARLVYLDWFAPTDLRLAGLLGPRVDLYVTKHLLRDRARYGRPVYGDTTLMEHYGRRFGLAHEVTQFPIPEGFWNKLLLGPSFVTAGFMLPDFAAGRWHEGPRPIDLHARIAVGGTPWYEAMRRECSQAVDRLRGVDVVTGTGIGHHRFMAELRQAKICFSPFGYGEVCWRDYEAVLAGAALLKQDMGHVETDPDIFEPGETYVPVNWDLSDFGDKVQWLLADEPARRRIARAAFDRLHAYAASGRFAEQMAPMLGGRDAVGLAS